ncbi:hypothetical protein [Bacteroides sp.]
METTEELKDWIDVNIKSIGIKGYEDFFTKKTGYCPSKWKNDFKELAGMTLRDYLIKEKMKICWNYKMKKQDCSNIELMSLVNYDLTMRSFYNHMRGYEEKYLDRHTDNDIDATLFHNTAVFSEILVRLGLYLDLAKPEIEDNFFLIEHNVENTAYQIDNISCAETKHCYKAFIDLDDLSLSFMGPWVQNSSDDEGKARFYQGMGIYAYYIDRINRQFQQQTGLSLTESIKGWDDFYEDNLKSLNSFFQSVLNINSNQNSVIWLGINRRAKFILATDAVINEIKAVMFDRCKRKLIEKYGITYDTMQNYVQAVGKLSYLKMKHVLETVDTLNDERAIKLFIELTQCPCLGDFLWIDRSSDLDDEYIEKLSHRSQSEIINFLIDFKKELERYDDDEYYMEEINDKWCKERMKEW